MKTPHKPFNLEHARAGAPYGCANGYEATILKWGSRNTHFPLLGCSGGDDSATAWRNNGLSCVGDQYNLVMLPLGYIDGKPVFVGDELVDPSGATLVVKPSYSGHLANCMWPAPAKVYPETRMNADYIAKVIREPGLSDGGFHLPMTVAMALANAAISRACEDGDVVPREMVEKVAEDVAEMVIACLRGNINAKAEAESFKGHITEIIKSVLEGKA